MQLLERLTDTIFAHDKEKTFCNTGAISTDIGNYLIDTGMYPKVAKTLLEEIKNIKSGNFKSTFTTHYHIDHIGGNQIFNFKPIYAHKLCRENLANVKQEDVEKRFINDSNKALFEGFKLTNVTTVYETDTFSPPENSDIICYLTGGHTNGSVIVYYKPENVVFAGDNVVAKTFHWGGDKTADPYKMLESLEKIISFRPQIIVPGHGPIQNDLEDVIFFKNYMIKIIDIIEKSIKESKNDNSILSELMNIPFHTPPQENVKILSLIHWIEVIKRKNP